MGLDRGKWTIGLIFAVAIVMGACAIVYHHYTCDQILKYWDGADGNRIRRAGRVERWIVRMRDATVDSSNSPGEAPLPEQSEIERPNPFPREWGVELVGGRDAKSAPGIVNARHALVQDMTYDWSKPVDRASPDAAHWDVAFWFADDKEQTIVLFDTAQGRVWQTNSDVVLQLNSEKRVGYEKYLREMFE
jgi:hypothetical protein